MAYCAPCDRDFERWSSYYQHMRSASRHNYCEGCNKDFPTYPGLRQHWIQSPRHHFCRQCDCHFGDDDDLAEHCVDAHHYCGGCDQFFQNARGLHEHNRQSHHYCVECRILFNSENNLRAHLGSSVHRPKNVPCAFQHRGCTQYFVSKSAMILHLETGKCTSGVDRNMVNQWIRMQDRHNVVTVPSRLLTNGGETTQYFATDRSWNGDAWECVLCHNSFPSFAALNSHLASPRHQEKTFHCPLSTCRLRFTTLSGLCQHVESESCGILRFRIAREGMDRLLDMNRMRIQAA